MYDYFRKGLDQNDFKYPLTMSQIKNMESCEVVSPRAGKRHGVQMPAALCNDSALRVSLEEVLEVREMVKNGKFPREFMEKYYPREWGEFPDEIPKLLENEGLSFEDPAGLADVVHMDTPLDLGEAMIRWLISEGAAPNNVTSLNYDFLTIVPKSLMEMSIEVYDKMEICFEVKYYFGVPRPEEVADDISITHYDEGSPSHPSFPAGHGAAAFASCDYFIKNWKLNENTKKALFDSAYIWAMARTLAGVHYAVDNLTFASQKI